MHLCAYLLQAMKEKRRRVTEEMLMKKGTMDHGKTMEVDMKHPLLIKPKQFLLLSHKS
jgi:hypothetical protein